MDFLEKQANATPALAESYGNLGDLYTRKLWHQLTNELLTLISTNDALDGEKGLALLGEFISKFEAKLNQLQFAQMVVGITRKVPDLGARAAALAGALAKARARLGPEAALLLAMEAARVAVARGDAAAARGPVEEAQAQLEGLSGAETRVHAAVYRAAAAYHKAVGPPEAFYRSALMLLAYTPAAEEAGALAPDAMTEEEKGTLAVDLALAALTGDGVFNFGEVLATPILGALAGTPHGWLGALLTAFREGDVDAFAACVAQNQAAFDAQPALASRADFVREKIALLALMNLVFERPAADRHLRFADIAARTRLPPDLVEGLCMRAMSLGLVRGVMDGVAEELAVSWVQPRVLDDPQLRHLQRRLGEWGEGVKTAHAFVEDQTPELFN
mmetsp:Transcript_20805/g.33650  ORF Transcript_20805/g.33650 Transcript_20805/m.33650 type:complete len:389 (+) Transcript_20805:64-1230(+)